MHETQLRLRSYRFFPYELALAEREVHALTGLVPHTEADGTLTIRQVIQPATARRFTYFGEVVLGDKKRVVPMQALLEQSAEAQRQSRQQTRYSAHGIHEYKGKFNPQIVRAICNVLSIDSGSAILDPFCGSGTVLLESLHDGRSAVGVDLNPLATLIANAKIAALRARPDTLRNAGDAYLTALSRYRDLQDPAVTKREVDQACGASWRLTIPNFEYLAEWFPYPVLGQMHGCLATVDRTISAPLRSLFRVFLSHCLRECSWQDPGDLRIRRRKEPASNYALIDDVTAHVRQQVERIARARECLGKVTGKQTAICGDSGSDEIIAAARATVGRAFDAVITSPPYASALPYADTQRLSLALLLLSDSGVRRLDRDLLGTREVGPSQRVHLESELHENAASLPEKVVRLCRELMDALTDDDGFRRANVPALLYRYFSGMRRTFLSVLPNLRAGAPVALVVGPNQTRLGGRSTVIQTPELLAMVGESVGLRCEEIVPLDAYHRYSLHSENSIRAESLVVLRR